MPVLSRNDVYYLGLASAAIRRSTRTMEFATTLSALKQEAIDAIGGDGKTLEADVPLSRLDFLTMLEKRVDDIVATAVVRSPEILTDELLLAR